MLNQDVLNDLLNPGNTNIIPGLDRMQKILQFLGNPQDNYQTIHITGTNGKGSTATFIESGLIEAGYKVGKFTSPHILSICECIKLNNTQISEIELEESYYKIKKILVAHQLILSPFEFLTAIMFDFFSCKGINWLVLEVGMGGLNDSTNVVNSRYSIITNVELEHTKFLGNTINEIANEKSGIIKNGLTVIADNNHEVMEAVLSRTNKVINVLNEYDTKILLDTSSFKTILRIGVKPDSKYTTKIDQEEIFEINLFGKFQAYNFLCAYTIFRDMGISHKHIKFAAEKTIWPGRVQKINEDPLIILDATHNASGAKNLYDTFKDLYDVDDIVIITSILQDKDIKTMLGFFSKITNSIIYTSIDTNPRGIKAEELAVYGSGNFKSEKCIDKPIKALEYAKGLDKKIILITGSLYLLGYFYDNNLSL